MKNSHMLCLVGKQRDENKKKYFFNLLYLVPDHDELNITMPKDLA